jgi:hypothetical protein
VPNALTPDDWRADAEFHFPSEFKATVEGGWLPAGRYQARWYGLEGDIGAKDDPELFLAGGVFSIDDAGRFFCHHKPSPPQPEGES